MTLKGLEQRWLMPFDVTESLKVKWRDPEEDSLVINEVHRQIFSDFVDRLQNSISMLLDKALGIILNTDGLD